MTENIEPETPASPAPADVPNTKASVKPVAKGKVKAAAKKKQVDRPYPRATLERAIAVAMAIKDKNGGEPWAPKDVAKAMKRGWGSPTFFYEASSAQKFGLTTGGRDSKEIGLTQFGHDLAFAGDALTNVRLQREAFLKVPLFKQVLEHYKSPNNIDMEFVGNVLQGKFGLDPDTHQEFIQLFKDNCSFVGIQSVADMVVAPNGKMSLPAAKVKIVSKTPDDVVTVAEAEDANSPTCFVIMPFGEKGPAPRPKGFFEEVLQRVIIPAAKAAGFRVQTARKKGTEVIHSTIINSVMDADLVVADLTDHNPNVLCELGMRLMHDKPVTLIRATGTTAIFDVDHLLRVEEYDPNLWASSVEKDVPRIQEHIEATWAGRHENDSFLTILRKKTVQTTLATGV